MISFEDRRALARDINLAHRAGARLRLACEIAGITVRTLQRWRRADSLVLSDARPRAAHPKPARTLNRTEHAEILRVANEPRFVDTSHARIVPMLADEGRYIANESTFAHLSREQGQTSHRGRARQPRAVRVSSTHIATAPSQVWCWDINFLATQVGGRWFYFYLILDLYNRKIVSWEVHDTDDSTHAAHLVRRAALAENIQSSHAKPILHDDNGATLKATTVLAMLYWLRVKPSYSRPRVSNDNAYAASLFRTAKYRPQLPANGFTCLEDARLWARTSVHWDNIEHRHRGNNEQTLAACHALYQQARERQLNRWVRHTRNWEPIGTVTLNPERDTIVTAHQMESHKTKIAA